MAAATPFLAAAGQALGSAIPATLAQAFVNGMAQALRAAAAPGAAAGQPLALAMPGQGAATAAPLAATLSTPVPAAATPPPAGMQAMAQAALPAAMPGARAESAGLLPQAPPGAMQSSPGTTPLPAPAQATLPARAEAALAERAAMANAAGLPANPAAAGTTSAANAGANAGAAQLAASAPGNSQAVNLAPAPPPAAPLAQASAEARGNPLLAGGPAHGRADGVANPHGHTVDRAPRHSQGGESRRGLATALALLGMRASAGADEEAAIRAQADRMFQRLYWLLTITAYACAGLMLVVVAVPMLGIAADAAPPIRQGTLAWIGGLAALGLGTGLGAWWLARRTR